jgi:hypothetical protein
MTDILGGSIASFIGLTLLMFGAASWMMGQAVAETWRNPAQIVPYALLLAASGRFLDFALFGGDLLSASGLLLSWACLAAIALIGFRARRASQMVAQYPWLFERRGPLSWSAKSG